MPTPTRGEPAVQGPPEQWVVERMIKVIADLAAVYARDGKTETEVLDLAIVYAQYAALRADQTQIRSDMFLVARSPGFQLFARAMLEIKNTGNYPTELAALEAITATMPLLIEYFVKKYIQR